MKLETTGMKWDLYYRGKVHKVELVFWTIMVRCDTDEAELLCGKYRMRTGNVQSLCRSCTCPRDDTDNPKACYPFKTVDMMKKLIEEELRFKIDIQNWMHWRETPELHTSPIQPVDPMVTQIWRRDSKR